MARKMIDEIVYESSDGRYEHYTVHLANGHTYSMECSIPDPCEATGLGIVIAADDAGVIAAAHRLDEMEMAATGADVA